MLRRRLLPTLAGAARWVGTGARPAVAAWGSAVAARTATAAAPDPAWALCRDASGRYLLGVDGTPFFVHRAALWSLATGLGRADLLRVPDDRRAKGSNTVVFELIEHWFTGQSRRYRNKERQDPFTPMTDFSAPKMDHLKALFTAYRCWLLQPQPEGALVVSDLGARSGRICAALAADRSFAMMWTVWRPFALSLAVLALAALRARWYDPLRGGYRPAEAALRRADGVRAFVPPGDAVLVIDAA